jgi:hypothetical protein
MFILVYFEARYPHLFWFNIAIICLDSTAASATTVAARASLSVREGEAWKTRFRIVSWNVIPESLETPLRKHNVSTSEQQPVL